MGWRLACALVIAWTTVASAQPSPQQKIALQAKPAVVRVWGAYIATYSFAGTEVQLAIGGTGTGFFITADGYIATNAHVVSDIHDGDDTAKDALYKQLLTELDKEYAKELAQMSDNQINQLVRSIKLVNLEKRAYIVLPSGEHLDYEIVSYGKPGSGRDAAIIKVKAENAPTLAIGDSSKSQIADPIVVLGYPGVADMKELLDEKSQLQASVTDGTISSLKRATTGEPILQISAPITHGNSGGPALDLKGNVVGLATFGNANEVQGFNFLVASATLMDLVKDAKITPKESETSKLWRDGLELYWGNHFTKAVDKFQQVETLFPLHSEAPELIRQSLTAKKEGKEVKDEGGGNTGMIVGLVLGGIVVVGGGAFVATRKKGPPRGMPPQPGFPPPQLGPPQMPPPQQYPPQQQMYGRVQPQGPPPGFMPAQQMGVHAPQQPIAKTVAVHAGGAPAGGIAPTAFGSLSIGSLTCTRGQLTGQRFALTSTGIIVGRQPGVAHILVNDHRASGKHVWIGLEQGRLVAIDQGTTNGTYVNDVNRGRITRAELRDGDVIIVGDPDCCCLQVKVG
jgi:S1-C subfamily serine protease